MPPTRSIEKPKVADGSVPEESDTVAQMAADVEAETADYPEGAPEFLPVLKLPRMRRADAYEALGLIQAEQRKVKRVERSDEDEPADAEPGEDTTQGDEGGEGEDEVKPVELDPLSYGAQYRVIAYIEQYLGVVAQDPKAYATWAAGVSDADLVKTFNIYIRKTQPGEAKSSTG
jgi:hypothetical protein